MLPLSNWLYVADVNVGVLVILAMSSVGILGIILGGWSSNSHYPLLGALRSAAQLVSYEVALSFALLSGLMVAGTLSMQGIIKAQQERHIWFIAENYGFMIVPFVVYIIAATAETNRAPFDLPEAESELVAGFHTEYSGFRWALLARISGQHGVPRSAVHPLRRELLRTAQEAQRSGPTKNAGRRGDSMHGAWPSVPDCSG